MPFLHSVPTKHLFYWRFMDMDLFFLDECKQSRNDGRLGYCMNFMDSRSVCLFFPGWLGAHFYVLPASSSVLSCSVDLILFCLI